jgi:hypothetical protein
MQASLEVCYAGVVIARAEELREGEGGEFFIVMKDPLPVGTLVGLRSADSLVSVRVLRVVESSDGASSGMQVRSAGSDEAVAALWIPPPPTVEPASTPPVSATQAPDAVVPLASVEAAPIQAAPAEAAAVQSAFESPAAASIEEPIPVPADRLATKSVEHKVPAPAESVAAPAPSEAQAADRAPVEKQPVVERRPVVAESVPAESAATAVSLDSAAVPEAIPVAVGSSLSSVLEAAANKSETPSGPVEASGESSGDVAAPLQGDLPPARPVQGASGRRRTKRRR